MSCSSLVAMSAGILVEHVHTQLEQFAHTVAKPLCRAYPRHSDPLALTQSVMSQCSRVALHRTLARARVAVRCYRASHANHTITHEDDAQGQGFVFIHSHIAHVPRPSMSHVHDHVSCVGWPGPRSEKERKGTHGKGQGACVCTLAAPWLYHQHGLSIYPQH